MISYRMSNEVLYHSLDIREEVEFADRTIDRKMFGYNGKLFELFIELRHITVHRSKYRKRGFLYLENLKLI